MPTSKLMSIRLVLVTVNMLWTYEHINVWCINVLTYKRVNVWTYEHTNVWTYELQRHKMHYIKYLLTVLQPYDERYKQYTYIVWVLKLIHS